MAVVYLSFALPSSMLGVMWPDVRARFGQSIGALGLVTFSYGIGRLATAVSGRRLVGRLGMGRALVAELAALAVVCGAVASAASWPMFLVACCSLGMVSGALDSVGSTFIAARANVADAGLLHGSYGLGATIGPLVVAAVSNWRVAVATSVVVAAAAAVLTLSIDGHWPASDATSASGSSDQRKVPATAVAASVLALGALVAIEVTTGQWAYSYLTDARRLGDTVAAVGVAGYWGASTLGRLMMVHAGVGRLIHRIGLPVLAAFGATALFGAVVGPAKLSVVLVALTGLVLAPIVPALFAMTARRVGTHHALRVSGWQLIATNVGALSIPALVGVLVDVRGPGVIPVVAIVVLVAAAIPLLAVISRLPNRAG